MDDRLTLEEMVKLLKQFSPPEQREIVEAAVHPMHLTYRMGSRIDLKTGFGLHSLNETFFSFVWQHVLADAAEGKPVHPAMIMLGKMMRDGSYEHGVMKKAGFSELPGSVFDPAPFLLLFGKFIQKGSMDLTPEQIKKAEKFGLGGT